jgi:hypothetical protein
MFFNIQIDDYFAITIILLCIRIKIVQSPNKKDHQHWIEN